MQNEKPTEKIPSQRNLPNGPPLWPVLLLIALGVVVFSVLAEVMR